MCDSALRKLANERGLLVGGCFTPRGFDVDPDYGKVFAREMNAMVAENIMKPRSLQPEQGKFDFETADRMIDFATANNMKVRGHALAWHQGIPDWLANGEFTRFQALDLLKEHVFTVVEHFKGKVFSWDVINELIDGTGILRENNPWIRFIGADFVDYIYKWAHQADPDCVLFYNDFGMDTVNPKAEHCRRWLLPLLDKGVPIQGVGLQAHLSMEDDNKLDSLPENIRRFNEMGLTVHITELDVKVPAAATDADFERQAKVYRQVFEAALDAADCPAVLLWGFTDKYSWIPGFTKGKSDHALILDCDYARKPAYHAVCSALKHAQ